MPSTFKTTLPPGTIMDTSRSAILSGNFLACDGALLLVADYPDLFQYIGNAWGGDGITDFRVPDSRGKAPISSGTGAGLTPRTTGQSGGEEAHQLTLAEMASHNHGGGNHDHSTNMDAVLSGLPAGASVRAGFPDNGSVVVNFSGTIITTQGSNGSHNNMQPFIVYTQMIKV